MDFFFSFDFYCIRFDEFWIGDFAIVIEFRLDARLKQVLYSTATSGKEGKPPTSMSSFRLILVLRPRRRVLFR